MVVYITKYALTQGIIIAEMEVKPNGTYVQAKHPDWRHAIGLHAPDWHLTLSGAKERADEMRHQRIAMLEKQIANLRERVF